MTFLENFVFNKFLMVNFFYLLNFLFVKCFIATRWSFYCTQSLWLPTKTLPVQFFYVCLYVQMHLLPARTKKKHSHTNIYLCGCTLFRFAHWKIYITLVFIGIFFSQRDFQVHIVVGVAVAFCDIFLLYDLALLIGETNFIKTILLHCCYKVIVHVCVRQK